MGRDVGMDYPALVRNLRQTLGLTQEELARRMDVSFATVNAWENGRHRPIRSLARQLIEMARSAGMEGLDSQQDRGEPPVALRRKRPR